MVPGRLSVLALATVLLAFVPGCPNGAGISCPSGQMLCGDKCIFASSDPANCGGCGVACPGSLACIAGTCGCPMPLSNCGDVCVDTNVDGNNCGDCGVTCGPGLVCAGGGCAVTCGPNLLECGAACFDGHVNHANCGACGHACGDFELCCGSMCVMAGTAEHCGSCAPCPNVGDFCFDAGPGMGLTCSAG